MQPSKNELKVKDPVRESLNKIYSYQNKIQSLKKKIADIIETNLIQVLKEYINKYHISGLRIAYNIEVDNEYGRLCLIRFYCEKYDGMEYEKFYCTLHSYVEDFFREIGSQYPEIGFSFQIKTCKLNTLNVKIIQI